MDMIGGRMNNNIQNTTEQFKQVIIGGLITQKELEQTVKNIEQVTVAMPEIIGKLSEVIKLVLEKFGFEEEAKTVSSIADISKLEINQKIMDKMLDLIFKYI